MGSKLKKYAINGLSVEGPKSLKTLFQKLEKIVTDNNVSLKSINYHTFKGRRNEFAIQPCGANGSQIVISIKSSGYSYRVNIHGINQTSLNQLKTLEEYL